MSDAMTQAERDACQAAFMTWAERAGVFESLDRASRSIARRAFERGWVEARRYAERESGGPG